VPDGIGCFSRSGALGRIDGLVKNAGYNRRRIRALICKEHDDCRVNDELGKACARARFGISKPLPLPYFEEQQARLQYAKRLLRSVAGSSAHPR
jgi:hypothetical protein